MRGEYAAVGSGAEATILSTHLELLRGERERVERQISAVERTIAALNTNQNERKGLMSENMFDGFDHTEYKEEVEERWGKDAYARSEGWWKVLDAEGKRQWQQRVEELNAEWIAACSSGVAPDSVEAQRLADQHAAWLRSIPGTPSGKQFAGYLLGLGEMYVADERFAANYGGTAGAAFVRDALRVYVEDAAGDKS